MKWIRLLPSLAAALALAATASAQTDMGTGTGGTGTGGTGTSGTTGFAPMNFSNMILTSTPSNATGGSGISTVFSSAGNQLTFGTGGMLVNPMAFDYEVTGPNTAAITSPATASTPESVTTLTFTGENTGTYSTVAGSTTTTGTFGVAAIPSTAPIENVSARTTLSDTSDCILGFVVAGNGPRRVLIRAVGPGLAAFGITNALQNPAISLYRGNQLLATNNSWGTLMPLASSDGNGGGNGNGGDGTTSMTGTLSDGTTFTTSLATAADFTGVGAFALTDNSDDSGFVVTLPPGAYTVVVSSSTTSTGNGGTGTTGSGEVLAEVYFIQ